MNKQNINLESEANYNHEYGTKLELENLKRKMDYYKNNPEMMEYLKEQEQYLINSKPLVFTGLAALSPNDAIEYERNERRIQNKQWDLAIKSLSEEQLKVTTGLTREEYKERKKANRNLNKYMELFE